MVAAVKARYNAPDNIVLRLTMVEAKNLKPTHSKGLLDPYAMVCVGKPRSRTPMGSPRNSPGMHRRKSSWETNDVRKTQVIKSTLHPQWNESFMMNVDDLSNEEVHIYLWDSEFGPPDADAKTTEKPSGIRSLFRQIKHSVEFGRPADGFIGFFKVPLKEIPPTGLVQWFDLYRDEKMKTKSHGSCKLRLELSTKEPEDACEDEADGPGQRCTLEDFYNVTKQIYRYEVKTLAQEIAEAAEGHVPMSLDELPAQSRAILDQFAVQHHFSKLTELLIELVVLLECASSEFGASLISNKLLKDTVVNLEMEWIALQGGSRMHQSFSQKGLLTEKEMFLFDRAATSYVEKIVKSLRDIPKLFPPHELQLEELNSKVSLLVSLLNLHIWSQSEMARKDLSVLLVQRLQDDVKQWVANRLSLVRADAKEPLITETKDLVSVLLEAETVITPIYSVAQYFSRIGIDYFKIASLTMESRIAHKAQMLMNKMDQYQVTYQKFRVNIKDSSAISMQLYFALRNFVTMVKSNISERDVFRLTVRSYQSWFETTVIFWLQTFREEGIRRMEKALEIDKDVVQVTSLVKYSNSSVDVLSCFAKMTTEWRQIDFHDADICLLGVTKITDTICDGARQYAEKIQNILENNCYYDVEDCNAGFDVKDRLCITMNNIEHVRLYLHKLPQWLNFEAVTQAMAIKHEEESIGEHTLQTLHNLVKSADEDIAMRQALLVHRITNKMAAELKKYMDKLMHYNTTSKSSLDGLLDYIENNLQVLFERLESTIFPYILHEIWEATLQCFSCTLQDGNPPEYYSEMHMHLGSLKAYFLRGVGDEDSLDTPQLAEVSERLELHSQSTRNLMLQYLHDITLDDVTVHEENAPQQYFGHLALRVGYMKETGDNINIYATVASARSLPGVNRKGLSDAFVAVSLQPSSEFPDKSSRTRIVRGTLNPVFNETFQFPKVPGSCLLTKGTVLAFTVWHHDRFLPNEFLGEVILHLPDIPIIEAHQSIEDVPAALLPLRQLPEPTAGPYKVLSERCEWDKSAKSFLHRRRVLAGYESSIPMCASMRTILNHLTGKKVAQGSVFGQAPIR